MNWAKFIQQKIDEEKVKWIIKRRATGGRKYKRGRRGGWRVWPKLAAYGRMSKRKRRE